MADIVNNEYEKILNSYTKIFEFNRYDRLSYDLNNKKIADIAANEHMVNNEYYRNYGTYRHDITSEDRIVKINETYFDENTLDDNYYNLDLLRKYKSTINSGDIDINKFSGCVLNKAFATDANEASLEDIFCEYGYEYIKALNDKNRNNTDYDGEYYFTADDKDNNIVADTYEIMPIGYEYINIDKERQDPNVEDRQETVQYDGTYVPTVQELLSGELYIVIKSGNLPCRKIYFNNKYMPTLFINDDKLVSKEDQYIIDNQQPLKLCDLTLYQKLGTIIKWNKLFRISAYQLKTDVIIPLYAKLHNLSENDVKMKDIDDISLITYYKVYYTVENKAIPDNTGNDDITGHSIDNGISIHSVNDEPGDAVLFIQGSGNYGFSEHATAINDIYTDDSISYFLDDGNNNIVNTQSPNINIPTDYEGGLIHLHIKASYALKVKGYTNTSSKSKYSLYWYKIVPDNS